MPRARSADPSVQAPAVEDPRAAKRRGGHAPQARGLSDSDKQVRQKSQEPRFSAAPSPVPDGCESSTFNPRAARLTRMRRNVKISTAEIEGELPDGTRWVPLFVTLTYADQDGWRPNHLRGFLDRLRKWLGGYGERLRYVSVAELQRRGTPHYHLIVWIPARLRMPRPDDAGWWSHGSTNVQRARHAVGYLAKYASKGYADDEQFPKGLRLFSCGGLSARARVFRAWLLLPRWVKRVAGTEPRPIRRPPGGGIMLMDTGEVLRSPWVLWSRCPRWTWAVFIRRNDDVAGT